MFYHCKYRKKIMPCKENCCVLYEMGTMMYEMTIIAR